MLLAHVYSFGHKGCWEKNETLARMFNVTPRSISLWIGTLKKHRLLLWLHPKGYYRTLWAKSHPDVQAAERLPYRGREIARSSIISGQPASTPLRNGLPSDCETDCAVTAQRSVVPLRNLLPQTNNTTKRDTSSRTEATPSPLPAGGQAPALLADRGKQAESMIGRFKQGFGRSFEKPTDEARRAGREVAEKGLATIGARLQAK
jgi:hypothetical protein